MDMESRRKDSLIKVQTVSRYVFKNPDWAWIAVQQAGSPVSAVGEHALPQGNKRLAGLGDRIVTMLIAEVAFARELSIGTFIQLGFSVIERFLQAADGDAGDTNCMISQFGSNEYLSAVCDQHELTSCIVVNPAQNGVIHTNLKATTVEALLGAVYKDAGDDLDAAREVAKVLGIITTHVAQVTYQESSLHKLLFWITLYSRPSSEGIPDPPPQGILISRTKAF
ncbi:hypothetical protein CSUB01_12131 [Colletotrichum sublineola]|uniref:RNase III domain-containing protein n=1 Tax=Colletotrichum sublineola TaxID=1173701 RepID=A0A066X5Q3_COLSU|nr:hypothetical protein CSUB01_12131 [Colletotrichum sublineola]